MVIKMVVMMMMVTSQKLLEVWVILSQSSCHIIILFEMKYHMVLQ